MLNKLFDKSFLKFLMVGIINTAAGTGLMFVCYNIFKLSYWISSALNYVIGSVISYCLNKKITFGNSEKGYKPILRFTANILICYIAAYGIAKPFVYGVLSKQSANAKDNIALIAGMCIFVILNYFGQRFFAFKNQ